MNYIVNVMFVEIVVSITVVVSDSLVSSHA